MPLRASCRPIVPWPSNLHEALEQAASGHKRLVLISGEPGIGKTRLAAELGRSAHAEGANVLFGRCDEEALLPYQPFVETLRFYVANTPSDALMERLGRGGADVARIVPELRDLVPDLDDESAQRRRPLPRRGLA